MSAKGSNQKRDVQILALIEGIHSRSFWANRLRAHSVDILIDCAHRANSHFDEILRHVLDIQKRENLKSEMKRKVCGLVQSVDESLM